MVRYRYNRQLDPPAPFVLVTVRHPMTGEEAAQVAAQVDTAADRSVLPMRIVESLGLVPIGEAQIGGFGGHVTVVPTFVAQVGIHPLHTVTAKFIGTPHEPYVILGRDVLNYYRLVLDGPQEVMDID